VTGKRLAALLILGACVCVGAWALTAAPEQNAVHAEAPAPAPERNPVRAKAPAPERNPLRPLGPPSEFRQIPPAAWGPAEFSRAEPPGPPPPLPAAHPARAGKGPAPALVRKDQPADPPRTGWSEAEIARARESCTQLLASASIDHKPIDSIRQGACGAPAPILVTAIGANPRIELSTPATMTCTMAAALDRWAKDIMQPEARKHLKAPVVRLRNASSYACRNRYGARGGVLSEHAKANAFDISAFETEKGDVVALLGNWTVGAGASPGLPSRNPMRAAVAAVRGYSAQETFLRGVHEGACRTFGTVLGPDANHAHRDHFHFDMMERRAGYCR
jgi:hypothetical protein